MPGAGKHVPRAEQPCAVGKPHTSLAAQPPIMVHAIPPSTGAPLLPPPPEAPELLPPLDPLAEPDDEPPADPLLPAPEEPPLPEDPAAPSTPPSPEFPVPVVAPLHATPRAISGASVTAAM
jgi:hypothetical protein